MNEENNTQSELQALQQTELFIGLSPEDAALATEGLDLIELKAGNVLFHQGDAGDTMYLIISGELKVQLNVPGGGTQRVVSTVGAGSILGEMCLLLNEPRTATIVAAQDSQLWQVSRERFNEAVKSNAVWANKFVYFMAQTLAGRLRSMNRELVDLVAQYAPKEEPQAVPPQELDDIFQRLFANL